LNSFATEFVFRFCLFKSSDIRSGTLER
jgi:hypothetical protein